MHLRRPLRILLPVLAFAAGLAHGALPVLRGGAGPERGAAVSAPPARGSGEGVAGALWRPVGSHAEAPSRSVRPRVWTPQGAALPQRSEGGLRPRRFEPHRGLRWAESCEDPAVPAQAPPTGVC